MPYSSTWTVLLLTRSDTGLNMKPGRYFPRSKNQWRYTVEPTDCLAIEDSTNGVRAASQSDMTVVAYGDPTEEAISTADEVVKNGDELLTTLRKQGVSS
jgi:beta-phosphoglucomutase-like phosphatase (HAD superfamily)